VPQKAGGRQLHDLEVVVIFLLGCAVGAVAATLALALVRANEE